MVAKAHALLPDRSRDQLQGQPMATFLMVGPARLLTGSRNGDGDVSHGSMTGRLSKMVLLSTAQRKPDLMGAKATLY
jgi:hypothetical protein